MSSLLQDLTSVLAVAGTGAAVLYAVYKSLLSTPIPGIPYNKESANHILGDIPNIIAVSKAGGRKKLWCADLTREHNAPLVQFFFGMGKKPAVVIADYREARDILLRRNKEIIRGSLNCDSWFGVLPGQFIAMEDSHPQFKSARALVKDLITPTFLHNISAPASYEMILDLISLWDLKAKIAAGRPFDADGDISHMTFDIMMATAVGLPSGDSTTVQQRLRLQVASELPRGGKGDDTPIEFPKAPNPELLNSIYAIENVIGTVSGLPSARLFHFFNNNFNPKMKRIEKTKNALLKFYTDQAIQRITSNPARFKPSCAMDYIVSRELQAAETAGTKPDLHSLVVRDGLMGFITGGQDSTHSTLCFTVKHLGQQPEIQKKLRDALQTAYSDAYHHHRMPTAEEITKTQVPYLDAFIQEVLRYTPPAIRVSRKAAVDMNILGHFIPKGTVLIFLIYGPTFNGKGWEVPEELRSESSRNHREGFGDWSDSGDPAEEFRPERWLKPSEKEGGEPVYDGMAGPFMSFSSGKRGCWGQRIAYLQLKLVITLLVWNFEFGPIPEAIDDWEMHDEIFARPWKNFVRIKRVGSL
ncbi:related to cytochrome P450 monooxygenase [Cephalotrichum gorgonifer]|uniref:Related to cytochrome P450 monooxygenase n=1 Tax=Cephalotrichum gorgonifer TaxID=2041049 RepID=A0AAE8N8T8_9PEZI|nr:related to cytochrome P450 monooxygenase [Cephalotrichum gorgonifer]